MIWSPDGKSVASAGKNDIQIWDITARQLTFTYGSPGGSILAWSPDGRYIASSNNLTASVSTPRINVWVAQQ